MKIQVVTPWYPDSYSPYSGVFVKKQVDALVSRGHQVSVENPEIYPAPPGEVPAEVWKAMRELASTDTTALFAEYGESTRVPAPVPSGSGMLGRAEAFRQALELKRDFLPVDADITHAHLGIPTGLALLDLGDRPLVVTEHQSTLVRVFAQTGGVTAYSRVVAEAAAFLCVSEHLKEEIVAAIGEEYADRIRVVPNVVDLEDIRFRVRSEGQVDRWIYVGTVFQHKGIDLLLRSFRLFRRSHPGATLTIVGQGPHTPWVERFIAANGLNQSVELVGSVPHGEVGKYLDAADVMVHVSPAETFGIASLEAIGAGLPLVSLRNGGADSAWGEFEDEVGRLLPLDSAPGDVVAAVRGLYGPGSGLDLVRGRNEVEVRFSAASVAMVLESIYQEVA